MKKILIGLLVILVIFGVIYCLDYYSRKNMNCIQVLVAAKNRFTGEVRTFGNPCQYSSLFWKSYPRVESQGFYDYRVNN